jgi:hypothetical protein
MGRFGPGLAIAILKSSKSNDGQAEFSLSDGIYQIQVDYMGHKFKIPAFILPESSSCQSISVSNLSKAIVSRYLEKTEGFWTAPFRGPAPKTPYRDPVVLRSIK